MELLELYSASKQQLSTALGASEDLLHVHAPLLIFFVSALILRRRMRSWLPVAIVFSFAIANEAIDAFSPASAASRWEVLADVMNTVFWPTLLFLLARRKAPSAEAAPNASPSLALGHQPVTQLPCRQESDRAERGKEQPVERHPASLVGRVSE